MLSCIALYCTPVCCPVLYRLVVYYYVVYYAVLCYTSPTMLYSTVIHCAVGSVSEYVVNVEFGSAKTTMKLNVIYVCTKV